MNQAVVLDLFGEGFFLVVMLSAAIVLPSLMVGLLISMFQAATQINEQTLSFLPRLLITLLMVMWAGSWILTQLSDLFQYIFTSIPILIG